MSRRTQQVVIAVIAVALVASFGVVGLAGLFEGNGSDHAGSSATPTDTRPAVDPSSQPTPSPTSAPPAPAELTQQTAEGAQASLRYLLDDYAYMMATGDTKAWTQGVESNCQVCLQFIASAQQLHQQGGYGVGGEFTVTGTSFQGNGEPPASGTATADFQQAAQTIVDDPKKQALQQPAVTAQIQARMDWDGERWRVGDMTITKNGASDAGGASDG